MTLMPTSGRFGPISKTTIEIAWREEDGDETNDSPMPICFYSTLPYGWIPDGIQDFLSLFLGHLKHLWLKICEEAHTTISNTVRSCS